MTVDLPNFGAGVPAAGFYDRDISAAIAFLERREAIKRAPSQVIDLALSTFDASLWTRRRPS